jgi:hypothetical protein
MGWEPERNRFSLSPHGIKAAQGHAARTVHDPHSVGGPECPPGILGTRPLNADPHRGGDRASPYASASSHRPRGEPRQMRPPHTASPHRYGADPGPRESDVISPRRDPRGR